MSVDPPAEQQVDEFALVDRHKQPGTPSTMSCPEYHGILWETKEDELLRFRCRVGHAYSDEAVLVHQSEQLEAALWTAFGLWKNIPRWRGGWRRGPMPEVIPTAPPPLPSRPWMPSTTPL